jgi:Peptidase M15
MPRRRTIHVAACFVALSCVSAATAQENSAAPKIKTLSDYAAAQFSATRRVGPSTDRGCLPGALKNALASIESRFGTVRVISTFRPGARIAGTHHMSLHATCRAVDFHPPAGKYGEVLAYLRANWKGGIGTYSGQLHHLHLDLGHHKQWHTHLGGSAKFAAQQPRRREATALGPLNNTNPY